MLLFNVETWFPSTSKIRGDENGGDPPSRKVFRYSRSIEIWPELLFPLPGAHKAACEKLFASFEEISISKTSGSEMETISSIVRIQPFWSVTVTEYSPGPTLDKFCETDEFDQLKE